MKRSGTSGGPEHKTSSRAFVGPLERRSEGTDGGPVALFVLLPAKMKHGAPRGAQMNLNDSFHKGGVYSIILGRPVVEGKTFCRLSGLVLMFCTNDTVDKWMLLCGW